MHLARVITLVVVIVGVFAVLGVKAFKGAIGNGFGGDNGCMFGVAGTTIVGDDTCFEIVGGCFNFDGLRLQLILLFFCCVFHLRENTLC